MRAAAASAHDARVHSTCVEVETEVDLEDLRADHARVDRLREERDLLFTLWLGRTPAEAPLLSVFLSGVSAEDRTRAGRLAFRRRVTA